jgi:small subunit ribosomal protein S2
MQTDAPVSPEVSVLDPKLEELLRAGVHFGYAKTRRHPRMRDYIAGVKSNVEILHLQKVSDHLERALAFIESVGVGSGTILWVGTKPAASGIIEKTAHELDHPFVNRRWLGGTLTNSKIIRDRIMYWQNLVTRQKTGELAKYTKQEQLMIGREIDRLSNAFGGLTKFESMPQALFIVDPKEEHNAFHEARLKNIPVVALLNTDCDPESITYPIPGNDNAPRSIEFILEKAKAAYLKGKQNAGN